MVYDITICPKSMKSSDFVDFISYEINIKSQAFFTTFLQKKKNLNQEVIQKYITKNFFCNSQYCSIFTYQQFELVRNQQTPL